MMKETKPKLDANGQIQHLIDKGVKFNRISVEEALLYLNENNNYFKLTSYRKNFPKHPAGNQEGQYIDLDFAMLKDLAIIDMRLRYVLVHMALDVEHFAKVKLIKNIVASNHDGYEIVDDYISNLKNNDLQNGTNQYDRLKLELERNKQNPYCGDIISKYHQDYPIWAFVEIIPFGSFINFYKFCACQLQSTDLINDVYLFLPLKELRNACAHNNCLINDLRSKAMHHSLNRGIAHLLRNNGISATVLNGKTSNERIRQIVTLLYTHNFIVLSEGVHKHVSDVLADFITRMNRNKEYYKTNDTITTTFEFLEKVIDILFATGYNISTRKK